VICPHCSTSLPRTQRVNRICATCKRRFALEPKESLLRTSDVRLRRIAENLSESGALRYTPDQLYWRLARNRVERPPDPGGRAVFGAILGFFVGVFVPHDALGLWAVVIGVVAGAVLGAVVGVLTWNSGVRACLPATAKPGRVDELARAWREVYGEAPLGFAAGEEVDEALRAASVQDPIAIVACSDRDVAGCLALNGVPQRLGVVVAHVADPRAEGASLPPAAPVLLLHDASAAGMSWLADARARWADGRTIDLGLTVAAARRATRLPELEGTVPSLDPRLELEPLDQAWLATGRSVALAALAPARILAAVEHAVAGLAGADAECLRARVTGFV
jgi:hypothetical protein